MNLAVDGKGYLENTGKVPTGWFSGSKGDLPISIQAQIELLALILEIGTFAIFYNTVLPFPVSQGLKLIAQTN